MGFVLARTDQSDHDRLDREGGGDSDPSTISDGLWFPRPLAGREAAGVSTQLFDIAVGVPAPPPRPFPQRLR